MSVYTIIAPTPISPLPPLPTRGAADFSALAHAYLTALREDVQPEQNNLALNVENNARAAHERATDAETAAGTAQGAAQAAVAAAGAVPWQSGGTYVAGSPPSTPPSCVYHASTPNDTYRCIASVSGR